MHKMHCFCNVIFGYLVYNIVESNNLSPKLDVNFLHVEYYKKEYLSDPHFSFKKCTRQQLCLNISFFLKRDLEGRELLMVSKVYIFLSNAYRYTGFTFRFNVCEYWENDIYGTKTLLSNHSNIDGCNIKKGFYYVKNLTYSTQYVPENLPIGRLKGTCVVTDGDNEKLLDLHAYGESHF